jgi:hypothetical protein
MMIFQNGTLPNADPESHGLRKIDLDIIRGSKTGNLVAVLFSSCIFASVFFPA